MAQLKDVINSGLLKLPTTANTSSAGYIWFDEATQRAKYSWCGGTWTTGGSLSTTRYKLAGAGTQNEALAFGGVNGPSLFSCTEEYDGTSWTAGGALITARYGLAGAGTQNTGLVFGGRDNSFTDTYCTEEYNGTSWSAGGALITKRYGLAGAGTQNAGLAFGGYSPARSCTEEYNGTSWTAGGALIIGRENLGGAGTQNAGLAFGGRSSSGVSCTEEYSCSLNQSNLGSRQT